MSNIEVTSIGIESHNYLGPTPDNAKNLTFTIKAINHYTGPRGLCPTLLVFGTLPQLENSSREYHKPVKERHHAAELACYEYEKIVTQERLRLSARKTAPHATCCDNATGDLVYDYRERSR